MDRKVLSLFVVVSVMGALVSGQGQIAEQLQTAENSALNVADEQSLLQQSALNKEDRKQAVSGYTYTVYHVYYVSLLLYCVAAAL